MDEWCFTRSRYDGPRCTAAAMRAAVLGACPEVHDVHVGIGVFTVWLDVYAGWRSIFPWMRRRVYARAVEAARSELPMGVNVGAVVRW